MAAIHVTDDQPIVQRSEGGGVHVSFDDGENWLRFRTVANYNACREFLDREQVGHDQDVIAAYHTKAQALMAERALLRSLP